MNMTHRLPHPRRQAGFNLMEVLVAIGLFAIGFAAVAAIFPAGALLQRQTADDVQARHVEQNAYAIILGTPVSGEDLEFYYDGPPSGYFTDPGNQENTTRAELVPFPIDTSADPSLEDIWPRDLRSFPSSVNDEFLTERSFYWVPLIRDANGDQDNPRWELVVFVLRRQQNRVGDYLTYQYPEPEGNLLPGLLRREVTRPDELTFRVTNPGLDSDLEEYLSPNDQIVDNAGGIHRIERIDGNDIIVTSNIRETEQLENGTPTTPPTVLPDAIWFAPASNQLRDRRSPALRVFKVTPPAGWGE
ncbi:prepilin-type N-terminal cleavage/methylation domain-containing protein [Phycisphaerales bacterium AB-hyl4]|uniref:Prepilin-type N-terminal cleavage/methylation domain-containing protein n=1 Tax=Natronomicrosphaera hydrolytica TaxID=3242702 RepID=A0ABV4U9W8_9BACT